MSLALKIVIIVLSGYILGNISFARILSKLKKKDITKQGSGNPGSMNMLRTFGFLYAILNLLLEAAKGAIAGAIGFFVMGGFGGDAQLTTLGIYVGGLASVLGHNFPVLYKFKGGKGVACLFGMYCVVNPLLVAICFVVGFIYLYFFDYGVISSFIFLTTLTVYETIMNTGNIPVIVIITFLYFCTLLMHRKNVIRLLTGTEKKANLKSSLKQIVGKKTRKERKQEELS